MFSSPASFISFSISQKSVIVKMTCVYSWLSSATVCYLISSFLAPTVSANCYYPDGTDRNANLTGTPYVPCLPGDFASMCCFTAANDQCRSDGLCFDGVNLWRESCTDPTWASPSCIKLCVNGTDEAGAPMDIHDEHVTQCTDGSYCCGIEAGAKACCANNEGVWIVNGTTTNVNPSSTTTSGATVTKSILVTPTSSAPANATGTGSPRGSSHTGPIVGGVVGGVAVLVIFAVAVWFFWRRRAATRDTYSGPGMEEPFHEQEVPVKEANRVLVEATGDAQLHEMDPKGIKLRPAELHE